MRLLLLLLVCVAQMHAFDPFDDTVRFDIVWNPASKLARLQRDSYEEATVEMRLSATEEYDCYLPKEQSAEADDEQARRSASRQPPSELLASLANTNKCIFRVEPYWHFELCFGVHIRQMRGKTAEANVLTLARRYHEAPEGSTTDKTAEYFLGRRTADMPAAPDRVPTFLHQGIDRPFYAETYTAGTVCDLTQQPRQAEVRYVCDPTTVHALEQVAEVSTCVYQLVVHTSLLCANEDYEVKKEQSAHQIQCFAKAAGPAKPAALAEMDQLREDELQELRLRAEADQKVRQEQRQVRDEANKEKVQQTKQQQQQQKQPQSQKPPQQQQQQKSEQQAQQQQQQQQQKRQQQQQQQQPQREKQQPGAEDDDDPVATAANADGEAPLSAAEIERRRARFTAEMSLLLRRQRCFEGGSTGWWQFEWCHGKHVKQIHREKVLA